jgi:tripartite-type tricarboxylate transporter receptor subunit TctC/uncharacterized protein YjiS (DUF1127 family)
MTGTNAKARKTMNGSISARLSLIRPLARLVAEVRYQKTLRELAGFDDRMLADIGVPRSGIDFAVRHGVRRIASVPRKRIATFAPVLAWPMCAVLTLVAALSIGLVMAAPAEHYPVKAVRLVVPFAPGGPNDISARIIADELTKALQQTVIVDNRPGAGGNIGAEAAARSAPDGHALFWAQAATHGINPSLYRKLAYDAIRDFKPVGLIVSEPLVLVTGADSPWRDVKELIAAAKADSTAIHFGSGGIGTTPHMAAELFAMMAGIRLTHVPYRGNAPAVSDVIAGRIQLVFDGINASLGHIRAGTLRVLAVTGRERAAALPHIAALAETLPGYEVRSWGGIAVPAGTPVELIRLLSREFAAIGAKEVVQRRFADLGAHLEVSTPEAMDAFVHAEIARWRTVVERSAMRVD